MGGEGEKERIFIGRDFNARTGNEGGVIYVMEDEKRGMKKGGEEQRMK